MISVVWLLRFYQTDMKLYHRVVMFTHPEPPWNSERRAWNHTNAANMFAAKWSEILSTHYLCCVATASSRVTTNFWKCQKKFEKRGTAIRRPKRMIVTVWYFAWISSQSVIGRVKGLFNRAFLVWSDCYTHHLCCHSANAAARAASGTRLRPGKEGLGPSTQTNAAELGFIK